MKIKCPYCGHQNEINTKFEGNIICSHCKRELHVFGPPDEKVVELKRSKSRKMKSNLLEFGD